MDAAERECKPQDEQSRLAVEHTRNQGYQSRGEPAPGPVTYSEGMMNRRRFLRSLSAGTALASAVRPGLGYQRRPPNIVFILMDDLGWADLACYGSTYYETPNLDRLAREGVRFTDAYAAAPVCSPTRASIMTGKCPARLGLTNYLPGKHPLPHSRLIGAEQVQALPLEEITIAEALRAGGYRTAHIGKWHLGEKGFWPENQGFDLNIGGTASGMPRSFFYPQWGDNPPIAGKPGEYLTDRLTEEALAFIRSNRERPFFLYLPHYAVHVPIEGKTELVEKYRKKLKPGQKQNDPIYAAMIESMDQSVGRIAALLDELKLSGNTLVVFTSDNGGLSAPEWKLKPVTSNAPLREGKGHLYEGGIRVPLIVRGPGVRRGAVCDAPVSSIDFFPTLARQAGLEPPAAGAVDGVDISALLGGASPGERTLYWHYPHYSNQLGKPASAVRRGDFKLIEFHEDGHAELYHLKEDIGEQKDLSAAMPEKTRELRALLRQWLAGVNARMPSVNSQYDPEKAGQGYWWQTGTTPR
jgi:arylsulfatase A-like enzyme